MSSPVVTIILPNYRTPELTKLCLRALHRFTRKEDYKLIAVDNASEDESLEMLRREKDAMLIERPAEVRKFVPEEMHGTALDLALAQVDTPFVLIMHTDTIVLSEDWLPQLLAEFDSDKVAAVGSWKLEHKSFRQRLGKWIEGWFKKPQLAEKDYYPRSHCAIFRMAPIRQFNLRFNGNSGVCRDLCRRLREENYEIKMLPVKWFDNRIAHLNHATMILHPELGGQRTSKPAARRKLDLEFAAIEKKINS